MSHRRAAHGTFSEGSASLRGLLGTSTARSLLASVACAAWLSGCAGEEELSVPECLDVLDAMSCNPRYPAQWDRVFSETIEPRCGVAGGACHANPDADGARDGFVVTDENSTYAVLLGEDGATAFVEPSDPSCSVLMVRLHSEDPEVVMPPGQTRLDEEERCAVAQWIAQGAQP